MIILFLVFHIKIMTVFLPFLTLKQKRIFFLSQIDSSEHSVCKLDFQNDIILLLLNNVDESSWKLLLKC